MLRLQQHRLALTANNWLVLLAALMLELDGLHGAHVSDQASKPAGTLSSMKTCWQGAQYFDNRDPDEEECEEATGNEGATAFRSEMPPKDNDA